MRKFDNYKKALGQLKLSKSEYEKNNNEFVRDSVIQRYEFTIELAWKAVREYLLDQRYTDINSPKKVMQAAYAMNLIENDDLWLVMLDDRNKTAHLYDEDISISICNDIISKYIQEFDLLETKLNDLYS